MKKKTKLAAIGAVLIIATVSAIFFFQIVPNQKKPANSIRVACVGDSITEGSDYPNDLWMLLGRNYTVGNFGRGGTTVSLEGPTSYMSQPIFQKSKEFQPDIVIIMLGTNDASPSFQSYNASFADDYLRLVDQFQALTGKPKIWLTLPPPILNNGTGLSTEFLEQNVIPNIEQVANKTNLPLINVHAALFNFPGCFPDGVHPNSEGAQLIAKEVYRAIISK